MIDSERPPEAKPATRDQRLRSLVMAHLDRVARTLRNLGVPESEVDDDVQRVFLVVARRLEDIRPGAERSFLFQTATHIAAHARRRIRRRREVSEEADEDMPADVESPEDFAERQRARKMLDQVLDKMDDDLRSVFVAYELEEMTMVEIAETLGIPQGTVASRLRRARECFQQEVARRRAAQVRRAQ